MPTKTIAITGGIGAGKSVISRIVATFGYKVYDSDSRAKKLMDESAGIKNLIAEKISPHAIVDGAIKRDILASVVFSNPAKLAILNSIVHHHVRADISEEQQLCTSPLLFIETAILYESGLDKMVEEVWEVTAPENIRVERVVKRNCCTPQQAMARIEAQRFNPSAPHPNTHIIINNNIEPVLPQVQELLRKALITQ